MSNVKERDLIAKVKFLSQINSGDKIDVRYMQRQPKGIFQSFWRSIETLQDRRSTFNFVSETISDSISFIKNNLKEDSCKSIIDKLVVDLLKCEIGLNNLIQTYEDDLKFKCDIETVIEYIQNELCLMNLYDNEIIEKDIYT
jgi:hypothetical protein